MSQSLVVPRDERQGETAARNVGRLCRLRIGWLVQPICTVGWRGTLMIERAIEGVAQDASASSVPRDVSETAVRTTERLVPDRARSEVLTRAMAQDG